MRKPSVVFFNRVYPPVRGASGRVLRDLARAFARDGWDVTVITAGAESRNDRDGSIRVIRVKSPLRSKSAFAYARVWIKMLVAGLSLPRRDLVVTMTDPPLFVVAGRFLAKTKKSKHMHWCQDLYPDILPSLGVRLPPPLMKFFKVTSRRAMKSCDKVVVVGRCMAKHLTHSGMDPHRVAVIPNWPDIELANGGRSRRLLRTKMAEQVEGARPYEKLFRDTEPKFRVLYAGNLGRAHPLQTILEAADLLSTRNPEIEFVFVGDGPQYERLAQERARRSLENIRFLPWQPAARLRELMESGDLHLITLREDAAGLLVPVKLYAALAVGRPCILIGPRNTETAKVIEDFRAGSVVPQGDARTLAKTILAYRLQGNSWFAAHEGATRAGQIFVPDQSINAWIERARKTVNMAQRPVARKRAA